jgi:hypothetical protein
MKKLFTLATLTSLLAAPAVQAVEFGFIPDSVTTRYQIIDGKDSNVTIALDWDALLSFDCDSGCRVDKVEILADLHLEKSILDVVGANNVDTFEAQATILKLTVGDRAFNIGVVEHQKSNVSVIREFSQIALLKSDWQLNKVWLLSKLNLPGTITFRTFTFKQMESGAIDDSDFAILGDIEYSYEREIKGFDTRASVRYRNAPVEGMDAWITWSLGVSRQISTQTRLGVEYTLDQVKYESGNKDDTSMISLYLQHEFDRKARVSRSE